MLIPSGVTVMEFWWQKQEGNISRDVDAFGVHQTDWFADFCGIRPGENGRTSYHHDLNF